MILTHDQLTIIRAALQFWAEEMTPHDADASRGYLDQHVADASLTRKAITRLGRDLQTAELRYGTLLPGATSLLLRNEPPADHDIAGTVLW